MKHVFAVGVGLCVLIMVAAVVGLNWYRTGLMHSRCVSIAWGAAILGLVFFWLYEDNK